VVRRVSKKIAKWVLSAFVLSYLADQILREVRLSIRSYLSFLINRRKFQQADRARVNIGCGSRPTPGWFNLDISRDPAVIFWDCRRGLPFRDGSVEAIYAEHLLEHLDPETEAKLFLGECRRCLLPHGVLRLVVPDAGMYIRLYGGSWDTFAAIRPLRKESASYYDAWLGCSYRTQMEFINAVFRQNGEHKFAYDAETLCLLLRDAGFARVVKQEFGVSLDPKMAPDSSDRRAESLYVEAVKE
jgi:SAM-dependent methyltransferase